MAVVTAVHYADMMSQVAVPQVACQWLAMPVTIKVAGRCLAYLQLLLLRAVLSMHNACMLRPATPSLLNMCYW